MAAVGGFTLAGELEAQAGEPTMQAGNFPLSTGSGASLENRDISVGQSEFRFIYNATGDTVEAADNSVGVGGLTRSTIDITPRDEIPRGQMRDVWMFQTNDDGQVYAEDGDLVRTDGLETAAYLSLFGGNVEDDGTSGNRAAWWGNAITGTESQHMTSRYQNFIEGREISSADLLRAEDLAMQDLSWLSELGLSVDSLSVSATGLDRTTLKADIGGQNITF